MRRSRHRRTLPGHRRRAELAALVSWSDIAAIAMAITAVAGIHLAGLRWLLDRRDASREGLMGRIDHVDGQVDQLTERVIILEREKEGAPGWHWETVDEFRKLDGELRGLAVKIEGIKEEQGHQRDGIKRIENHLLERP